MRENARENPSLLGEALRASLAHTDTVTETGTVKVGAGDKAGGVTLVIGDEAGAGETAKKSADVKFFHDCFVTALANECYAINTTGKTSGDIGNAFDATDCELIFDGFPFVGGHAFVPAEAVATLDGRVIAVTFWRVFNKISDLLFF